MWLNKLLFLQIVGEIRAARDALVQITAKLRSYFYREIPGPNQLGNITVHGSISPAKGSPRGPYQGSDIPMPSYQQAQHVPASWKVFFSTSMSLLVLAEKRARTHTQIYIYRKTILYPLPPTHLHSLQEGKPPFPPGQRSPKLVKPACDFPHHLYSSQLSSPNDIVT